MSQNRFINRYTAIIAIVFVISILLVGVGSATELPVPDSNYVTPSNKLFIDFNTLNITGVSGGGPSSSDFTALNEQLNPLGINLTPLNATNPNIQIVSDATKGKALQISSTATSDNGIIMNFVDPSDSLRPIDMFGRNKNITFEVDAKTNDTTKFNPIMRYSPTNGPDISFNNNLGGAIIVRDGNGAGGGSTYRVAAAANNTWYHVKAVMDNTSSPGKYRVFLGDNGDKMVPVPTNPPKAEPNNWGFRSADVPLVNGLSYFLNTSGTVEWLQNITIRDYPKLISNKIYSGGTVVNNIESVPSNGSYAVLSFDNEMDKASLDQYIVLVDENGIAVDTSAYGSTFDVATWQYIFNFGELVPEKNYELRAYQGIKNSTGKFLRIDGRDANGNIISGQKYDVLAHFKTAIVLTEQVIISPASAMLSPGGRVNLTATILPATATKKNIEWTSSDSDIATVVSTGDTTATVTAKELGSATIKATSTDGSNVFATCSITVSDTPMRDIAYTDPSDIINVNFGDFAPGDYSTQARIDELNAALGLKGIRLVGHSSDRTGNNPVLSKVEIENGALKITNLLSNAESGLWVKFNDILGNKKNITYEANVSASHNNAYTCFIRTAEPITGPTISGNTANWQVRDGGAEVIAMPFDVNTWYKAQIVMDNTASPSPGVYRAFIGKGSAADAPMNMVKNGSKYDMTFRNAMTSLTAMDYYFSTTNSTGMTQYINNIIVRDYPKLYSVSITSNGKEVTNFEQELSATNLRAIVAFDNEMDEDSLNQYLVLTDANGKLASGVVGTFDKSTWKYTLNFDGLQKGNTYTLRAMKGIKNSTGKYLKVKEDTGDILATLKIANENVSEAVLTYSGSSTNGTKLTGAGTLTVSANVNWQEYWGEPISGYMITTAQINGETDSVSVKRIDNISTGTLTTSIANVPAGATVKTIFVDDNFNSIDGKQYYINSVKSGLDIDRAMRALPSSVTITPRTTRLIRFSGFTTVNISGDISAGDRMISVVVLKPGKTKSDITDGDMTAVIDFAGGVALSVGDKEFHISYNIKTNTSNDSKYTVYLNAYHAGMVQTIFNYATDDKLYSIFQNAANEADMQRIFENLAGIVGCDIEKYDNLRDNQANFIKLLFGMKSKIADKDTLTKYTDESFGLVNINTATRSMVIERIGEVGTPEIVGLMSKYNNLGDDAKTYAIKCIEGTWIDSYDKLYTYFDKIIKEADDKYPRVVNNSNNRSSPGSKGSSITPGVSTFLPDLEMGVPQSMTATKNPNNAFSDITPNIEWAIKPINWLHEKGIVNGFADGTFRPNAPVTREQFIKMLVLGIDKHNPLSNTDFIDVPADDWSRTYIGTAQELGITNGIGGGKFGYGDVISRGDLALMIYRITKSFMDNIPKVREYIGFSDLEGLDASYIEAIKAMYEAGIIDGTGKTFNPNDNATRAQSAKIIYLFLHLAGYDN